MKTKKCLLATAVGLSVLLVAGCASTRTPTPVGPTDQELVTNLLTGMFDALRTHDIDGMAGHYSDDFMSNQGTNKEQTVEFLKGVKEQGFLDGMEVDTAKLNVVVEGETASADGVEVRGAFGVLALSFKLEKRAGNWLVTYQSQQ